MRPLELAVKILLPILGLVLLVTRIKAFNKRALESTASAARGREPEKISRADRFYFRGLMIMFLCVIPFFIAMVLDLPKWVIYAILGVAAFGGSQVFIGSYLRGSDQSR